MADHLHFFSLAILLVPFLLDLGSADHAAFVTQFNLGLAFGLIIGPP